MEKFYTSIVAFWLTACVYAQDVDVNLLKAPSSPAANLIGTSPSEILRPTDPKDFELSLQNATNGFIALPGNFAVDIAPAWFFSKIAKKISYREFASPLVKYSVPQSFVFSLAYRDSSTAANRPQLALGVKFSLRRGKVGRAANEAIQKFYTYASVANDTINDLIENDAELIRMRSLRKLSISDSVKTELLTSLISSRTDQLKEEWLAVQNQQQDSAENVPFNRYGFKADIAGGLVWDFRDRNVSNGRMAKAGAWITFGYDKEESDFSVVGIVRYLYNPAQAFADTAGILEGQENVSSLDFGGKLVYDVMAERHLSLSAEGLYRSILNGQIENLLIKPSWRFTFNAEYKFSKTILLTLALGKDFDGTLTRNGNTIAFLNLLMAFGSQRSTGN